jgi:hypothetical protein
MPSIIVRHFRRQLPVRLSQGAPNRRPLKNAKIASILSDKSSKCETTVATALIAKPIEAT